MVILEAKKGRGEELKLELQKVAKKSRQERGCIEYVIYQDKSNPGLFGLHEKWESQETHQEQFSKSYILEFATKAEDLMAKPYVGLAGDEI